MIRMLAVCPLFVTGACAFFIGPVPCVDDGNCPGALVCVDETCVEAPERFEGVALAEVDLALDAVAYPSFADVDETAHVDAITLAAFSPIDLEDIELDRFAVRYRADIAVTPAGEWRFIVAADDAARVFVNGTLVTEAVEGDGEEPQAGSIVLEEGRAALDVHYLEDAGLQGLRLSWEGPETPESELPASALSTTLPAE